MPLKINVGLSRKIGEPNYSSRGGNVHFEAEVEATLVREPEELRKRIHYLFRLAEQSLREQLAPPTSSCGAANDNGEPRMATDRQLRAIDRLAQQTDAVVDELLSDVFDTDRCDNLSLAEASQLISILQDRQGGGVDSP